MDGALLSGALLVPAVDIHMKTRRGRIARQHIHAVQEYRPDSLRRDIYIFFLFTPVTPNRSVRDSTFRSAVQFNNNAASGLSGGIAVDGGDVT